jgi:hypothetical protein
MHDEEAAMDERARARLELLRKEFELGQTQLAEVDAQRTKLTEALLRISGAIQVLEELVGDRPGSASPPANGAPATDEPALSA